MYILGVKYLSNLNDEKIVCCMVGILFIVSLIILILLRRDREDIGL